MTARSTEEEDVSDQADHQPASEPTPLETYIRANLGAYTESALRQQAIAAGHSAAAVDAALAAARGLPAPAGGRAARTILIAYGAVFALLSVGMLLNSSSNRGEFMPEASGGIFLLAISLGVSLLASGLWIASRRTFWSLAAFGAIAIGLSIFSSSLLVAIVLFAGAVGVLWLVWRSGWRDVGTRADLGVLLVVPLVLLLGVAGTCLASGLPLPVSGPR